jgi:hypothetical protein
MNEIKKELFAVGFTDSYPYSDYTMVKYSSINGNSFHIYLDPVKYNRVKTLRGINPKSVMAAGLIGNFISGKGSMRKFSFKSPQDLINKLEKISTTF